MGTIVGVMVAVSATVCDSTIGAHEVISMITRKEVLIIFFIVSVFYKKSSTVYGLPPQGTDLRVSGVDCPFFSLRLQTIRPAERSEDGMHAY